MTSFLHKEGRRSMTIYQLECFIAVAEELNFSAAAERLFTTQPAITYQINALEKETGLRLFERTTRRTKLTAAGQSFYLDMVQMTSFGRQALKKAQDIQDADRSHLTVGLRQLFDYSTFSSILAQFQHQFPNACVDVVPQDNRRPLEQLRSGQLDIGFFYATEHSRDRDISFTPLFALGYHVLMNPNSPLADRRALHLADLKGQSVVSSGAFDYGSTSFLLTGDMEKTAETDLVNSGANLKADVLQVGHHGSSTSTSYLFLNAVLPEMGVISCGTGNKYGHPHEETLSILRDAKVDVYRTDLQGTITIGSDGQNFTVGTERFVPDSQLNPTDPSSSSTAQQAYIGNVNSKKFHLPTCPNLPAEKNQVLFSSYDEAIAAGYTPCASCIK
jgi:DNA-binding transcriptional LysR family regulator